ncbi:hypothetical protein [uncultured Nitrosomonas sp.]|uniref:hypothetical protein n=1 Tax=uncultured Nitrosomonas sp. TaxID=156424 RepID=UPI0025FFA874|nr:hypothetical protein [uncultured Nitrosomonas sp.]
MAKDLLLRYGEAVCAIQPAVLIDTVNLKYFFDSIVVIFMSDGSLLLGGFYTTTLAH